MLTFESLLLKELQKQQSRAEFCDIVLQTQGVSVPVHSCVLSAFSPWLCGALSTMPSPRTGQKRLIEVDVGKACTLLSLVSLLYSGQFNEDKEEVLSAACKLGINIPQPDITAGSKSQESKAERAATEQKSGSQVGTQTELTKEAVGRECQTEFLCAAVPTFPSECSHPKETVETVNVIGSSSWRTDQEICTYAAASDITLTTLQDVQSIPEKLPSFQVMDVVPETSMYPTVSAPACAPQVYVCPPASSSTPPPTHPYTSYSTWVEPLANQGQSSLGGVSQGEECVLEGLEQFENNIPGFINFFFDATSTNSEGQRGQSQRGKRGTIKTEGKARRVRRARLRGACSLRWEGLNTRKIEQNMHRCGRVARLVCIGQGGGRVGSMFETRQVFKYQGRFNRRQGRGAIYKVEDKGGRTSKRGRPRIRESRGRFVEPARQDTAPPMKRQRGRPRKRPLPLPNASQTGMSQSEQKVTNHPAPSLMHTATLPAANQTGLAQPMDWLIDDVIAQLPFIPPITSGIQNNQDGTTNTATLDSNPRTQPSVKLSDPGMVQPQPEGELTDILDSFLRTFDQHVGACDVDDQHGMPGGSQSNITDKTTNAYQQSAESYTVQTDTSNTHTGNNSWYPFRTSPMNTTPPQGLTVSLSQNRPQVSVCRSQKPSFSSEVPGVIMKKIKERPSEEKSESRRMTRSQSRKRDMKNNVDWQWREELPAKRRRNRQTQELENKGVNETKRPVRQMQSEKKGTSCKVDSCNVASALRKVMSVPSSCSIKCSTQSKKNIQKTLDRSQSSDWCGQKESCQSVTKNTLSGSHPEKALSAFELMKNLLENQRKRQEEKDHQMWTVERRRESEKMLMSKCAELTTGGKRAQTSNQTTSLKVTGQEERLIKNSYNQPTFVTVDSPSDSPFESTSESSDSNHATVDTEGVMLKDVTAMPHVSRAVDPAMLPKEPGHTQSLTDSSEEDVDIDEVSSSFTESFPVLTVSADIVPSTEEEDDEEEIEIDVLGSN